MEKLSFKRHFWEDLKIGAGVRAKAKTGIKTRARTGIKSFVLRTSFKI